MEMMEPSKREESVGLSQPPFPAGATETERLARGYGPVLRRLFAWAFGPVSYPAGLADQVQALAREGVVVHVSRSASLVIFLFLQHLLVRLGAPAAWAVSGLGTRIWLPLARLFAGRKAVRAPFGDDVPRAVRAGRSALVFLRKPGSLVASVGEGIADPFPALVALQRTQSRPIFLVPELVIWTRNPAALQRNLLDVLFGEPEAPGFWRSLFSFVLNRRRAFVRVGQPVNLQAFVAENAELDDRVIARKVRGALHQHLARETRVITGPPLKHPERLIQETLRDRHLRAVLAQVARERGRADGSVEREAEKALREIAARYSPRTVDLFRWVLSWVFRRIYDGIEVDEEGIARVARASARAPLVVCPSHKSHIDYLIVSYLFFERGLVPPHIAAGINLDFWPVGTLFRKSGAFFIRRSIKGDKVYAAVLKAYVKKLLKDGFSQEFFIEGGRSRTGKVLLPRFGMLSMEVDAWVEGVRPDVAFAPVWIGYAKIIEERSYAHELGGGEKRPEDLSALLSAPQVLTSRYGRIHLRIDEPLSLAELAAQRGFDRENHTEAEKRDLVRALGFRVVEGINRVALVTPMGLTCTVLLAHDQRGLAARDFVDRATFLARLVRDAGGQLSFPFDAEDLDPRAAGHVGQARAALVRDRSLVVHESAGEQIYAVVEEKRLTLDYYKNTALHFFVPDALLATAALTSTERTRDALERRTLALSRLFKHEFIYEAGAFSALFARRVERFLELGLLRPHANGGGEELEPVPEARAHLRLLADLLVNFVETYLAAAEALGPLLNGPRDARDLVKGALERARGAYLAGRLRRRESLNKATFENAFALFEERGLLARSGEKQKQRAAGPALRSRADADALVEEIRSFLVERAG